MLPYFFDSKPLFFAILVHLKIGRGLSIGCCGLQNESDFQQI
jgi:hypothetical protein